MLLWYLWSSSCHDFRLGKKREQEREKPSSIILYEKRCATRKGVAEGVAVEWNEKPTVSKVH
jgi:hypothetical protein